MIPAPCTTSSPEGIGRRKIFGEDADYDDILARLEHILLEAETKCFAWALFPTTFTCCSFMTESTDR